MRKFIPPWDSMGYWQISMFFKLLEHAYEDENAKKPNHAKSETLLAVSIIIMPLVVASI